MGYSEVIQFDEFNYTANAQATHHNAPMADAAKNHYNLVYREEEREMLPLCRFHGIAVLPWSPLARGLLAGKGTRSGASATVRTETDEYARRLYFEEHDFQVAERVAQVAGKRGVPPAQIALAWLLGRPGVTAPVVGATRVAHVDDAVASMNIKLDDGETRQLEECYKAHPVLGHEGPPC